MLRGMDETTGSGFYRELLDELHDGVYFVDRDRRITYWNRSAERISGFPGPTSTRAACAGSPSGTASSSPAPSFGSRANPCT